MDSVCNWDSQVPLGTGISADLRQEREAGLRLAYLSDIGRTKGNRMTQWTLDRRDAMRFLGMAVASGYLTACGGDESTSLMAEPSTDDDALIRAWERTGVLTPSAPGAWGEKIAGHYPLSVE